MQAISREIHELLTQGVPITTNLIITEAAPGTKTITLYPEDLMLDEVIIRRSCSSGKDFALGGAEASELTATIINEGGKFNKFTFEGATVDVRIKIGASTIRGGTFVIDERPAHGDLFQIKAFDNIARLMCDYDSDLAYPATVNQILQDACSKCNLTLDSTTITNGSYEVANKPDRATYQEVVRWCAEIAGGFAYCDDTGALKVGHYTQLTVNAMLDRFAGMTVDDVSDETGEKTVNEFPTALDNVDAVDVGFYSMKRAEKDVSISGVTYEDDEDIYIAGTDKYTLDVSDNQLLTDNPTDGIYLINEVVNGIAWRPASELITVPLPYIWPGDLVIVIEDSKPYTVLVTDHVCNITKESSIVASGEPETIKGYATAAPLTAAQRRTISKISKEITRHETNALEQETLNLFNTIAGSLGFHETTVIEDGRKITYVHDLPALEDSMVIATMTDQGWASTTTGWNNGEPAWAYGATFDGSLVMRVISTVGLNADWVRAGELIGGKVHFDLDEGTFLIGNSDEDYQLYFDGTSLKLGIDTSVSWGDIGGKPTYLGADRISSPEIYGGNIYGGTITSGTTITGASIQTTEGNIGGFEITPTGLRKSIYKTFGPFTSADVDIVQQVMSSGVPPTQIQLDKYDMHGLGYFNSWTAMEVHRMVINLLPNPRVVEYVVEINANDRNKMVRVYAPEYLSTVEGTTVGISSVKSPRMISEFAGSLAYSQFSYLDPNNYRLHYRALEIRDGTVIDANAGGYTDLLSYITDSVSTTTGVTGVNARVFGKVVTVRFLYKPTTTGFIQNVITMPAGYRPPTQMAMAIATTQSTADAPTNIMAYLGSNGTATVVTSGTLPTYELLFTVTYIAT